MNKPLKSVIFEESKWEKSTDIIFSRLASSLKEKKSFKLVILFKYISISEPAFIINFSVALYFLLL